MARKLKLMSLFQELNGRAQMSNRRPAQPATGIYLMQLRAQVSAIALPRRRLMISVELSKTQPLPHPVKIHHVGGNAVITKSGVQTGSASASASQAKVSQVQPKAG